jgi:hypothetical protein
MVAFDMFWYVDARNFQEANGALMVLLSLKSPDAAAIKDYCSIFQIHAIRKLVSKVLANRLAPRLGELVHASQSAFVKGRFILVHSSVFVAFKSSGEMRNYGGNGKLSLAQMVRFLMVEPTHPSLNPKFDMCIAYLWLIIFLVVGDVFINSETLFNRLRDA